MDIWDFIKGAIISLRTNKFRTFLTLLGIIIGVGSVVTLLSIGKGAQASIEESFNSFGSNNIYVLPGKREEGSFGPPTVIEQFKVDQIIAFMKYPKIYSNNSAAYTSGSFSVRYENESKTAQVLAVLGDYATVINYEDEVGRLVSSKDIDQSSRVVTIGPDLAEDLFEDESPIGKSIKIDGTAFKIIGIYKSKGSSNFENNDDNIIMPYPAFNTYLVNSDNIAFLSVSATSPKTIEKTKKEVETILRKVRNLRDDQESDFTVRDSGQILNQIKQVTGIFTVFLAAIAAISLIVGGIGVMNIMLVSITERTKEIGLRKSLGATNFHILIQFLTESMVVSLAGGIIGIIIGILLSYLISSLANIKSGIYIDSIALAIIFSLVIGLVFGIYPAKKASKLSPIDALRYE